MYDQLIIISFGCGVFFDCADCCDICCLLQTCGKKHLKPNQITVSTSVDDLRYLPSYHSKIGRNLS